MAKRKITKRQTMIYKTLHETKDLTKTRGWTQVLRNG